jgi:hypothetical protein
MCRFGHEVEPEHSRVVEALLGQLAQERAVARKRAAACLGALAVVVADPLLNRLIAHLLAQIASSSRPDVVRTHIQVRAQVMHTSFGTVYGYTY